MTMSGGSVDRWDKHASNNHSVFIYFPFFKIGLLVPKMVNHVSPIEFDLEPGLSYSLGTQAGR